MKTFTIAVTEKEFEKLQEWRKSGPDGFHRAQAGVVWGMKEHPPERCGTAWWELAGKCLEILITGAGEDE